VPSSPSLGRSHWWSIKLCETCSCPSRPPGVGRNDRVVRVVSMRVFAPRRGWQLARRLSITIPGDKRNVTSILRIEPLSCAIAIGVILADFVISAGWGPGNRVSPFDPIRHCRRSEIAAAAAAHARAEGCGVVRPADGRAARRSRTWLTPCRRVRHPRLLR
jgi:hypothetical protein